MPSETITETEGPAVASANAGIDKPAVIDTKGLRNERRVDGGVQGDNAVESGIARIIGKIRMMSTQSKTNASLFSKPSLKYSLVY